MISGVSATGYWGLVVEAITNGAYGRNHIVHGLVWVLLVRTAQSWRNHCWRTRRGLWKMATGHYVV